MAAQKRKGPGDAPTLPSPVSNNPGKVRTMGTIDSAGIAGKQDSERERIVDAMIDLEGEIIALRNMALIAADLFDNQFTGRIDNDDHVRIIISKQHMEMACFAWNDIAVRANTVAKMFGSALTGRAPA